MKPHARISASAPDSVMRDDQRLVVGDVECPVTRGVDVVVGPGARHGLPQRAVPRREMIDVAVAQRVPDTVFGQPRRIPATGTGAVMMAVLRSGELHRSGPIGGRRHAVARRVTGLGHLERTAVRFSHHKAPISVFVRRRGRVFELTDHVLRRAVFPRG